MDLECPKIRLAQVGSSPSCLFRSNFLRDTDHASHVTMSVIKMMGRIVAPKGVTKREKLKRSTQNDKSSELDTGAALHDHTFGKHMERHCHDSVETLASHPSIFKSGITSDPLTQFACAFSALIHDVDHQGIPNT